MEDHRNSIRAFIALPMPDSIKSVVGRLTDELIKAGGDVSWIRTPNLHLTIKFLGQVLYERIPEIKDRLEETVSDCRSPKIQVEGVGAFPKVSSPRVLWAGIHSGQAIIEIQKRVEEAMVKLGFDQEDRPFKPHLTLGRVRSSRGQGALIRALESKRDWSAGECSLSTVSLMQSQLDRGGAIYTSLWSKTLSS